ncbi:MAG: hypothetical protein K0Q78_1634 [Cellvibrio sp.]|jgi:hypothetical protein|nr:hypothetical protein [Cellvibrio sp.]
MKTFLSLIGSAFILVCSAVANAYPVSDVVVFNRILQAGDSISWEHDMTQYGHDPADVYRDFILTLEVRDAEDAPGKMDEDRPFYMLAQGQGRTFGRIGMEDLIITEGDTPIHLEDDGVVKPFLMIMEGSVWIGSATLTMDLPNTSIPEPGIVMLWGMGLLGLALRRRPFNFSPSNI